MSARYRVFGTDAVKERLKKIRKTAPEALLCALYDLGERVMDNAVERVPVNTGELRDSAYVGMPQLTDGGSIELGFGADHAVKVHEMVEVPHASGEAKFLERAVLEHAKGNLWRIAKIAERYIERGGSPRRGKYPSDPGGG